MDDPNITMEEYIRLEEERARKHRKVFNWETAEYGKIWYDDDILNLRSVEIEFPAIVFNDNLTSNETLSCKPTRQVNWVHILDFVGLTPDMRQDLAERMRMIYTKDDWQEEMAKDEFGAYWLGSERMIPDKGDLSYYWAEISSGRDFLRGAPLYAYIRDPVRRLCHRKIGLQELIQRIRVKPIRYMAPLPPRDQRHLWLSYQVVGYTEEIVHDFEQRLKMIFRGSTCSIKDDMRLDVAGTLCFQLGGARHSMTWRDFLRGAPSYAYIRDPVRRLCHRYAERRKSGARLSGAYFIRRLAHHFVLVSDEVWIPIE
nr:hypothetical protein [Tanacetum cinerariifolium]